MRWNSAVEPAHSTGQLASPHPAKDILATSISRAIICSLIRRTINVLESYRAQTSGIKNSSSPRCKVDSFETGVLQRRCAVPKHEERWWTQFKSKLLSWNNEIKGQKWKPITTRGETVPIFTDNENNKVSNE